MPAFSHPLVALFFRSAESLLPILSKSEKIARQQRIFLPLRDGIHVLSQTPEQFAFHVIDKYEQDSVPILRLQPV